MPDEERITGIEVDGDMYDAVRYGTGKSLCCNCDFLLWRMVCPFKNPETCRNVIGERVLVKREAK